MAEQIFYATKFGILGIGAGVLAGSAANFLFLQLDKALAPSRSNQSKAGQLGFQVYDLVAGAAIGAGMLLVGDKVVEYMGGEATDPLFHTLYYVVGVNSMLPVARAASAVRGMVNMISMPAPPVAAAQAPPADSGTGCTTCSQ